MLGLGGHLAKRTKHQCKDLGVVHGAGRRLECPEEGKAEEEGNHLGGFPEGSLCLSSGSGCCLKCWIPGWGKVVEPDPKQEERINLPRSGEGQKAQGGCVYFTGFRLPWGQQCWVLNLTEPRLKGDQVVIMGLQRPQDNLGSGATSDSTWLLGTFVCRQDARSTRRDDSHYP